MFSNTATVNITVNPVNDAPSAVDDPYAANENTALSVTSAFGLLSNDSDIDGDVLHVGSVEGSAGNVGAATATTQGGSVTVNANGSLSYTPPADFTGSDTFTYKANDGAADSGSATVTFTVAAPVNHAPGLLSPRFIDGVENTPLSTSASGLANDAYDIDGDPLTFIVVTPPQHAKPGTFAVDATTGAWTYEPVTNFEGDDGFTWKVNDGLLDSIVGSYSIKISSSGGGGGGGGGCRTPTQLGPSFIC